MSLIEKLKKARESQFEQGGFTFTVRRPTELEMFEMRGDLSPRRMLAYVVGWKGVKESDLVNGGDPHPVQFDPEVCAEWLSDRTDLLGPVVAHIKELYFAAFQAREASTKN